MLLKPDTYNKLKELSNTNSQLIPIINEIEQNIENIKQKCYVHNKDNFVKENYSILIFGHISGYGAEASCFEIIDKDEYYKLVEKSIEEYPNYKFPNEWFGGRTSDTMFTVMDFIGCMNICCCPELIEAARLLSQLQTNLSELKTNDIDIDYRRLESRDGDIEKCIKISQYGIKSKHCYTSYTESFTKLIFDMKEKGITNENFDWLYDKMCNIK